MELGEPKKKGSLIGSILLIAGCCIGAGMLGTPVSSAQAGFLPSTCIFVLCWLFMMITGLLLLEVNLHFKNQANLITMAEQTLGFMGKAATWFLFLFLFYCIMVAYSAGSGELVADFVYDATHLTISHTAGSILFVLLFGIWIYLGTIAVDRINRLLMFGLISTFLLLFVMGLPHIQLKFLSKAEWNESFWAIPIFIVSFGYHNLVPSLTSYLDYDVKKIRLSIIIGSAIPLICYILWQYIILGMVSADAFMLSINQGHMVTSILKEQIGNAWIVDAVQYFAFFAIVTSFLGVALSFVDFLTDGLQLKKDKKGRFIACLLVFVPPLLFAIFYPTLFVTALKYAGGFGAVLLFGVLPGLMVWQGRYQKKLWTEKQVFGGKAVLLLIMLVGFSIFILQLTNTLYFHK